MSRKTEFKRLKVECKCGKQISIDTDHNGPIPISKCSHGCKCPRHPDQKIVEVDDLIESRKTA